MATKPTKTWTSVTVAGTAVLHPGGSWSSDRMRLSLLGDGNLVLSDRGRRVWETGTAGRNATQLVMQADGNLVLYDAGNTTVWSTHTDGHNGATLVLGADGTMRVVHGGKTLWRV